MEPNERIAMLEGVSDRLKTENQLIRAKVQNAAVSVGLVDLGEGLNVEEQMELPARMKDEILRLRLLLNGAGDVVEKLIQKADVEGDVFALGVVIEGQRFLKKIGRLQDVSVQGYDD